MHTLTKPALFALGVGVVAITTGTAIAAIQWLKPDIRVDTKSVTILPNGNKRVWISLESCQGQSMQQPERNYYEVKANSSLTLDHIKGYLESTCESDLLAELFPDVIKKASKSTPATFKPGQEQFFTPYATLEQAHEDHLIINTGLNGESFKNTHVPVDKNVRVYSKGQVIKLSDLQPGRDLTLILHTSALDKPFATETMRPEELALLTDGNGLPKGATVFGVIQREYKTSDSIEGMRSLGHEWTRLEKDKNTGDWRQVTPLD